MSRPPPLPSTLPAAAVTFRIGPTQQAVPESAAEPAPRPKGPFGRGTDGQTVTGTGVHNGSRAAAVTSDRHAERLACQRVS